jgi:hypothetical protein
LTNDEWYRVTRKIDPNHWGSQDGETDAYSPTEAASPLACVEQSQWCNSALPTEEGCTQLTSFGDANQQAGRLFNVTTDILARRPSEASEVATRIIWPILIVAYSPTDVSAPSEHLGSHSLQSRVSFYTGVQGELADNQWQLDVRHWFAMTLAALQAAFLDAVQAANDTEYQDIFMPANNTFEQDMCARQVG